MHLEEWALVCLENIPGGTSLSPASCNFNFLVCNFTRISLALFLLPFSPLLVVEAWFPLMKCCGTCLLHTLMTSHVSSLVYACLSKGEDQIR